MLTDPASGRGAEAPWRFWYSGPADGATQMEIDAALLAAVAAGRSGPVLRLYTWHPPAVSIGFHQDPARELDLRAVAARGWTLVRRPTGGRAILHDDELTYAVAARADDPQVGGSLLESHAAVSRIFLVALRSLGIPAEPAAARASARTPVPGRGPAPHRGACFATATSTELVVRGRKILGSAQRRQGGALLQHGSLLLGEAHLDLADVLRLPPGVGSARGGSTGAPPDRATARAALAAATTCIEGELERRPRVEDLIVAVASGAAEVLKAAGVRFTQEPPPGLAVRNLLQNSRLG